MAKRFNDVYIVNRDGVRIRKIDVCTGMTLPEVLWLDWSGDGKLWAVCRSNHSNPTSASPAGSERRVRVYRINPNGSGQTLFHALPAGHEYVHGFAVSKDGTRAVISSEHATTSARRTVVRTTAGAVTRIDALFGTTSWSPDGSKLVGWTSGAGLWRIECRRHRQDVDPWHSGRGCESPLVARRDLWRRLRAFERRRADHRHARGRPPGGHARQRRHLRPGWCRRHLRLRRRRL